MLENETCYRVWIHKAEEMVAYGKGFERIADANYAAVVVAEEDRCVTSVGRGLETLHGWDGRSGWAFACTIVDEVPTDWSESF